MNVQSENRNNIQKSILAKISVVFSFTALVLLIPSLFFSPFTIRSFLVITLCSGYCASFCSMLGIFFGICASIAILIKKNLKGGRIALLGIVVGIILNLLSSFMIFTCFEKLHR